MSDEEMPDYVPDPQDEEYREDAGEDDVGDSEEEEEEVEPEVPDDDESGEYEEEDEEERPAAAKKSEESKDSTPQPEDQPVKRRRGRPPGSGRKKPPKSGRFQALQIPLDENGKPYEVENDELVLPEDPEGEKKIDKLGFLKEGRDFRLRTFTILGRGQRQYMLATEPARCIGFRDSYLLFQRHRKLLKIKLADDEKFDLIDRELIPHSYKGRTLGVVTARSVFREFGARVIVGGKRVVDDYYEEQAKAEGHTPDELADPEDTVPGGNQDYDKSQYCAWYNAPAQVDSAVLYENNLKNVLQKQTKLESGSGGPDSIAAGENSKSEGPRADPELVALSTKSASNFNSILAAGRKRVLEDVLNNPTAVDPHTNVRFVPALVQPNKSKITRTSTKAPHGAVTVTTILRTRPQSTNLREVDPSVWETADEETKRAIQEQIKLEEIESRS